VRAFEPWRHRLPAQRLAQRIESRLGAGAQQPEPQMLAALRSAQPARHAHEDRFGEHAGALWIAGKAGQIARHGRLVARDKRRQRPFGAGARLRDETELALLFCIHARGRQRKDILPGHLGLSFSSIV
jgi:hypothetical protein